MVPYNDQSEVCKHAKPVQLVTVGYENIKSLDSEQLLHTDKSTFGGHNSSCARAVTPFPHLNSPNFLLYCINIKTS